MQPEPAPKPATRRRSVAEQARRRQEEEKRAQQETQRLQAEERAQRRRRREERIAQAGGQTEQAGILESIQQAGQAGLQAVAPVAEGALTIGQAGAEATLGALQQAGEAGVNLVRDALQPQQEEQEADPALLESVLIEEEEGEIEEEEQQPPTPAEVRADIASGDPERIFGQLERVVATQGDAGEEAVEPPESPRTIQEREDRRTARELERKKGGGLPRTPTFTTPEAQPEAQPEEESPETTPSPERPSPETESPLETIPAERLARGGGRGAYQYSPAGIPLEFVSGAEEEESPPRTRRATGRFGFPLSPREGQKPAQALEELFGRTSPTSPRTTPKAIPPKLKSPKASPDYKEAKPPSPLRLSLAQQALGVDTSSGEGTETDEERRGIDSFFGDRHSQPRSDPESAGEYDLTRFQGGGEDY